jgi:hypothetical protein
MDKEELREETLVGCWDKDDHYLRGTTPRPTTIGPEDWPKMVLTHVPDSGIGQSQS